MTRVAVLLLVVSLLLLVQMDVDTSYNSCPGLRWLGPEQVRSGVLPASPLELRSVHSPLGDRFDWREQIADHAVGTLIGRAM